MKINVALTLLVISSTLYSDFESRVENTNFTISQASLDPTSDADYLYNYNRLRLYADYTQDAFFFSFIGDGVSYYGGEYINSFDFSYLKSQEADVPFHTQTQYKVYNNATAYAKLYRAYLGYEDDNNRVIIGLQNISMGVGRIWNPANLFNPRNIYALEPDETFGVAGISYSRHINETSQLTGVISKKADNSFKYALQYKAYLEFADFAIDGVSSDDTKMLAYEIEGDFLNSGIEVRSEGAYIKSSLTHDGNRTNDVGFFQAIVGADYAFVNGITLTTEALYSSEKFSYQEILLNQDSEVLANLVNSHFNAALSLTYSFNIYLESSLLYIASFNNKNFRYISPTLTYTLNDYNSLLLGAMLQYTQEGDAFEGFRNSYYIKYSLAF